MGSSGDYTMIDGEDFEGHIMPPDFAAAKQQIENFEARNSDVWVTSYPKSGTTWCQELVWLVANDLDYERATMEIDLRFPCIELDSCFGAIQEFARKTSIQTKLLEVKEFGVPVGVLESISGTRYIKSHLPWNLLPTQIKSGEKTPKIIHVMRDPKQVVASYYPFSIGPIPLYKGNMENFIDLFIQDKLMFGNYFNTVLSYWQRRHLPNVLIMTYEEMHADIRKVIKKVSAFFGKHYSEGEIDKLAEHLSFDRMKNNGAVNRRAYIDKRHQSYMRKGLIDSYRTELTEEMITKLNEWILENAKGTGLPYEIK